MFDLRRLRVWLAVLVGSSLLGGGIAHAQSAVPESALETFLGLQQGDLTGLNNGPVMNGSAIKQSITVTAGTTLTFDYNFLTNEPPATGLNAINPFAFVTSPTLSDFADTFSPLVTSPAPGSFALWTGYNTLSETFATAGTYTLGIGVVNVTDNLYSSGLLLDHFQVTSGSIVNGSFETGDFTGWSTIGNTSVVGNDFGTGATDGKYQAFLSTSSVPEPSSVVLLVLGGLGAGALATFSRRARPITPSSSGT